MDIETTDKGGGAIIMPSLHMCLFPSTHENGGFFWLVCLLCFVSGKKAGHWLEYVLNKMDEIYQGKEEK